MKKHLHQSEPILSLIVLALPLLWLFWPVAVSQLKSHKVQVVAQFPSDPEAFTQGLAFDDDGKLFMGTGLNGYSSIREVDLATGKVLRQLDNAHDDFGEGVTVVGDKLIQLTWKSKMAFIYDKKNFVNLRNSSYTYEGWGIAFDGQKLFVSDGTDVLHLWDKDNFAETGQIKVYDDNGPVYYLNELEFVDGLIYANVWKTDQIARIDPETGAVVDWLDLTGLLDKEKYPSSNVLNGIAFDGKNLYVTGKRWPFIFQIALPPN